MLRSKKGYGVGLRRDTGRATRTVRESEQAAMITRKKGRKVRDVLKVIVVLHSKSARTTD